ncbi:hypothetical protein PIB30_076863, partial [Stylosanthes scabra]|nr:hypothetical protein [Stylosanthes scabra]
MYFPTIVNVDNPRQMNWARHVCSFLLDGITEMKHKNSKGVEGCVFALLIIYLHETHFGEDSEDDEACPPWLSYWRGDTLKERLKLEKKDSTPPPNAELNAVAMQSPPNAEINPAAVIEPHAESSSLNAEINADAAAAPLDPPPENFAATAPLPQDVVASIDTFPPDADLAIAENAAAIVDPPPQGVVAAIDHVMATPPDFGIEVVQATMLKH